MHPLEPFFRIKNSSTMSELTKQLTDRYLVCLFLDLHNELKRGKSPIWQDNALFASIGGPENLKKSRPKKLLKSNQYHEIFFEYFL